MGAGAGADGVGWRVVGHFLELGFKLLSIDIETGFDFYTS